jgi:hypothetical protein
VLRGTKHYYLRYAEIARKEITTNVKPDQNFSKESSEKSLIMNITSVITAHIRYM